MAEARGQLSCKHFTPAGTLIQAWASHSSPMRRKVSEDCQVSKSWRGESTSNAAHQSTSDPESRLYYKNNAASTLPSDLGHVFTVNRHGLGVNVRASLSDGTAEREISARMLADTDQPG